MSEVLDRVAEFFGEGETEEKRDGSVEGLLERAREFLSEVWPYHGSGRAAGQLTGRARSAVGTTRAAPSLPAKFATRSTAGGARRTPSPRSPSPPRPTFTGARGAARAAGANVARSTRIQRAAGV